MDVRGASYDGLVLARLTADEGGGEGAAGEHAGSGGAGGGEGGALDEHGGRNCGGGERGSGGVKLQSWSDDVPTSTVQLVLGDRLTHHL